MVHASPNGARDLVQATMAMCSHLCRQSLDFGVKRITLLASELEPLAYRQNSLFAVPPNPEVMRVVDALNRRFGRDCIAVGITPHKARNLHGSQQYRSPRYTTRWSEIPVVYAS